MKLRKSGEGTVVGIPLGPRIVIWDSSPTKMWLYKHGVNRLNGWLFRHFRRELLL